MTSSTETKTRKGSNLLMWFDARRRKPGMAAFALNRLTAIGLTVYLFLHLFTLRKLAQGPEAYDSFIASAKSPIFIFGELLVVIAGFYHGLNGIRIILTSFGVAVPYQTRLFYFVFALAAILSIVFAIRMVSA